MTINRITNTPMVVSSYNARGLVCQHSVTKNCVRLPNGHLYALVGMRNEYLNLIRSVDNGFSWQVMQTALQQEGNLREQAGLNSDGLFCYLTINEQWDNVDILMMAYDGADYILDLSRFDLSTIDTESQTPTEVPVLIASKNINVGMMDVCYNQNETYIVWTTEGGALATTRLSARSSSISADLTSTGYTIFGFLSCCCDEGDKVHIIFEVQNASSQRVINYIPYDATTPSYGSVKELRNFGVSPNIGKDLSLAIDGLGTLCAFWFLQDNTGLTATMEYMLSVDGGTTWGTQQTLSRTPGHGPYQDLITGDMAGRTNVIGGSRGGFYLTYCEDKNDGVPRMWVRSLLTTDGGLTYTLGDEKELTSGYSQRAITGVQWFHPPVAKLLDIDDPGLIRVAYSVNEGDSDVMSDAVPIVFGQELLSQSAYPSSLDSASGTYGFDTANPNQLLHVFYLAGGQSDNIDFYGAGLTGRFTDKYISAFNKIGTVAKLLRYEPSADNYMNDRSAYEAPTEQDLLVLFDPVTYSFPSPDLNDEATLEYIERDTRKLHVPPTLHLARTFLVNKGGYLKRTVWTILHDGNEYEVSQVLPRFMNNEICYYECNAYVVGPSRDPWARTVLTSET